MSLRNPFTISFVILTVTLLLYIADALYPLRTVFSILSVLFIPGYIVLKLLLKSTKLEYHEVVPVSIGLSVPIAMFIGIYLSFMSIPVTPFSIYCSLISLCLISYAIYRYEESRHIKRHENNKQSLRDFLKWSACKFRENISKVSLLFLVGITSILPLIDNILREKFFYGYDPFLTKPLTLLIIRENLSPLSFLYKTSVPFSGFFYFTAVFHSATGISLYNFTRYGGPIFLSLFSISLFILMYRIFRNRWVILVPFFYATNPFVVDRFLMTIAENFSLMILPQLIFVSIILYGNRVKVKRELLILGMLLGAILISHFLVVAFALFYILLVAVVGIIKRRFVITKSSFLTIIVALLLAFPYWIIYYSFILWEVIVESQVIFGIKNITIPPWAPAWVPTVVEAVIRWNRFIYPDDFSCIQLALVPVGLVYIAKNRNILTLRSLFFLIPWSATISLGMLYFYIGGLISVARFIIYIALLVALFSAIGLWQVASMLSRLTLRLNMHFTHKYKFNARIPISFLVVIVLTSNAIIAIRYDKWVPYESRQIAAAEWLREVVKNRAHVIVVPFEWDTSLIHYMDVPNTTSNFTLVKKLMSANTFNELNNTIHLAYPDGEDVYFFISKRWEPIIRQESLTILEKLALHSFLIYDDDVWILELPLYNSIEVDSNDLTVIDMSAKILWMPYLILNSWGASVIKGERLSRSTDGAWVEWTFTIPTLPNETADTYYELSIVFWGESSSSRIYLRSSENNWTFIGALEPDNVAEWESVTIKLSGSKFYDSYSNFQGIQTTFGMGDEGKQIWVTKMQIERINNDF